MLTTQMPGLFLMNDEEKGRCVHTASPISKGDLIEVCPVIVFSPHDLEKIHSTHLHDYYFLWGEDRKSGAIALGFGSLYNHSKNANAEFEIDLIDNQIRFFCIQPIPPGDEITISYVDDDYRSDIKLWF